MRIGISPASYLPFSAICSRRTMEWARQAGYEFIQVLPLRSVDADFYRWTLRVDYFEEAWNPAYTRRGPNPSIPLTIYDRLFFPSRDKCISLVNEWRDLGVGKMIVHQLTNDMEPKTQTILEVSPGLWLDPAEIKQAAEKNGISLALDLYHLRREPRPDELASKPARIRSKRSLLRPDHWTDTLKLLLSHTVLIHVSPDRGSDDECNRFLNWKRGEKWTELEEMLRYIKAHGFDGDYVVEAAVGLAALNPRKLKAAMARFRERLEAILRPRGSIF